MPPGDSETTISDSHTHHHPHSHHDHANEKSTLAAEGPELAEDPELATAIAEKYESDVEKGPEHDGASKPPPAGPAVGMRPQDFPDGGLKAWSVCAGGFFSLFVSFGWINCIGVFQAYYEEALLSSYSASTIAWILALEVFFMFLGGPIVGKLYDNYGPRWILLIGSFLHVFGLMMTSLSTEYYQVLLAQGVCSPIGASMVFYPSFSALATWFFKRRGIAFGLMVSGSSLGGVIFPIMVSKLIPEVGFPWTMRICAFVILFCLILSNILISSRLPPTPKPLELMAFVRPLKEPVFSLLTFGSFIIYFGFFTPFDFVTLTGSAIGASATTVVPYLVPILNAVSIFGRTLPGFLGDKYGRFNVTIICLILATVFVLAIWIPATESSNVAALIVFAAFFGFGSGAFIGMLSALVAQISDIREIGVRTGTIFAIASIAALVGNPISGALVQNDGASGSDYLHLQIYSGIMMAAGTVFIVAARIVLVGPKLAKKC